MYCGKRIKLVSGDTGPQLRLTLSRQVDFCPIDQAEPMDLNNAIVTLHFRAEDSSTLLFSRQATVIPPGTDGVAVVQWHVGDLDRPPGYYEGEVEIVDALGVRETVYDTVKFEIRDDFN